MPFLTREQGLRGLWMKLPPTPDVNVRQHDAERTKSAKEARRQVAQPLQHDGGDDRYDAENLVAVHDSACTCTPLC